MRAAQIALAGFVLTAPARAIEFTPENKEIANAAYVLKHAAPYESYQLFVYSPDRASLTGGSDSPVLVARTDRCTYAIKSKGTRGYKINFSKLTGDYRLQCRNYGCELVFSGLPGAACVLEGEGRERCFDSAVLQRGDPAKQGELLASIAFIKDRSCPFDTRSTPKPRF